MFAIIADTKGIKPRQEIPVDKNARSYDELLVEWLRELLYQYNTQGIIFTEFSIKSLTRTEIKALARGDIAADKVNTEIKAVTYHELEFKQTKTGYEAKVIFDV